MREIPRYDPDRTPADWPGTLKPTEVAVLFSHASAGVPVTPQGEPIQRRTKVTCMVFDDLSEAETFCRQACEKIPVLRCDIFDGRGESVPPLLTVMNPKVMLNPPDKKQRVRLMRAAACGMMALSFPLCYWDYRQNFALILPMFLGINCFLISLRLFHWAVMEGEGLREKERK